MNNFDSDFEFLIDKENKLSPDYVPANLIVLDDNENNFRNYKDATLKPMLRADIIPDLNKMLDLSEKLANNIPFVRIDFYNINGKIYSIRLYNRALTESEVNNNYEIDKVRFGIK